MSEVLEVLLAAFDEAYDRKGWHGTGLRGAVRAVEDPFWRPGPGRHNVWELTVHAAYWKYAVRRRLLGGIKRGSFALKGSNWISSSTSSSWPDVVALLDEEHRALREAIASLKPAALRDRKTVRMVYGVTAHDLYHAGQIQLVKRLQKSGA